MIIEHRNSMRERDKNVNWVLVFQFRMNLEMERAINVFLLYTRAKQAFMPI